LNADHNALDVLPDFVGGLIHLETLSVAHNRLRAVPESIRNCQRLTTVILASNDLTTLPAGLGQLGSLTELELGHNRLEGLPESLANLSLLVRLDCRENKLSLPPTIPRSARLAELLLGFNRLSALPSGLGLGAAPALSVLDVRDNGICELEMAALLRLRHLKTLDLRNNSVGKLPPLLGTMTCITSLLLEGNPLKTMRRALVVAPAREILEYLRGRMTEDDRAVSAAAASDGVGSGCDTGTGDSGRDEVMAAVRGAMSLDASLVMRQMHLVRSPSLWFVLRAPRPSLAASCPHCANPSTN
jgi:Leucine-rich repeat (LRR) protein